MSYLRRRRASLLAVALRQFFNFVGYSGALLIFYGVICEMTGQHWKPIEDWIGVGSAFLTLIGTILTALSIYSYRAHQHEPERFSMWVSAPATVLGAICAAVFLVQERGLPQHVVTGFTMLALAGSWFRIQPRPEDL